MTVQAISFAFSLASVVLFEMVRKTRACCDLGLTARRSLQSLELHACTPAIIENKAQANKDLQLGLELVRDAAEEARDLQKRIEARLQGLKTSSGLTKAKKLMGAWCLASGEIGDLIDTVERIGKLVQELREAANIAPPQDLADELLRDNEEARKFWGADDSKPWSTLKDTFQEHGVEHAASLLLNMRGEVHVGDFARVVKQVGFPLDQAKTTALAQSEVTARTDLRPTSHAATSFNELAIQERLLIAQHLLSLNKEWVEMADRVRGVINAIAALKDSLPAEWKPRWADVWAARMAKANNKTLENADLVEVAGNAADDLAIAKQINDGRHEWLHIYTRYMIFWRLAHVSCDVFMAIDFPGKPRAKAMIENLEPLDEVNLRLVIGGMQQPLGEVWVKGRPDVYRFLRVWLLMMGEKAVPRELCVGRERAKEDFVF